MLIRLPELNFINDGPGKPVGINEHIGRRPIAAFGNSDGDLQMLQWTMGGSGPRFALLVHHTDAEREWAYDRKSPIGRLDKALDEANAKGWTVVDMKSDWKTIFPFGSKWERRKRWVVLRNGDDFSFPNFGIHARLTIVGAQTQTIETLRSSGGAELCGGAGRKSLENLKINLDLL